MRGSKSQIAEWVVDNLPSADIFVDLFFGGGAITHRAMLSGKWKQFVVNDIDGRLPKFFLECCYGKHTIDNHKEWISREDFFRLKDDIYIALTWSFGNNGVNYIYGKDIEPYKKALHYACFFNDVSFFKEIGIDVTVFENEADVYKRYLLYKNYFASIGERNDLDNLQRLQSYERLESLYHLQSLQSLKSLKSLQSLQSDYTDALEFVKSKYAGNSILIYCDPPYSQTNCGKYQGFDSKRFYEWAEKQDNIFISEYDMPDNFIPYAWTEKVVLSAANGNGLKSREMIYTNKHTWKCLKDEDKQLAKLNFAEQMTLF